MATPTQLREAEQWFARYQASVQKLDARTVAAVQADYADVSDWLNPTVTLAAAATAATTARAAQQMQASLASEFMAVLLQILTGRRPTVPRETTTAYPRNADPFKVYSRPIFVARDAITVSNTPVEAAQEEAAQLAEVISLTDVLMARRNAALRVLDADGVRHYRRVIRPERSTSGTCGMCIAAASRVYSIADLMPLHSRCKCEVVPVLSAADIGERFNLADIRAIYDSTPETRRQELARVRFRVSENGELGPLLVPIAA